ncbi:hypothetical protein HZ326_28939 [Fusarium oxysporum f. sp. albedinis]|nr:hypothetical protein HZ326_28939 [Fusarium oxysporum f. sp. albedinis]
MDNVCSSPLYQHHVKKESVKSLVVGGVDFVRLCSFLPFVGGDCRALSYFCSASRLGASSKLRSPGPGPRSSEH